MDDVKKTLKPLEWSSAVKVIDKSSSLPMVVKPTPETAEKYGISKDPILLHHYWVTQRLVAQNLELEGTYVVGPQMDIPSEYTGTFQYRHDQRGNSDIVQVFSSVKEIASYLPEKVFAQERTVVYPISSQDSAPNGEKEKSLLLQVREQLTVLGTQNIVTSIATNRVPFGLGGKTRYKQVVVPCIAFLHETTQDIINLPLSTKGKFCTLSYIPSQGREFDINDVLREIDIPINLTTCRNCPQTLLDEHFLRPGMRLRITAIEEHNVILGVTTQEKIVEFASEGAEFILPKHLENDNDREQEIAYQTALQRFLMECQIKNSAVNIKDYRKSIRNHVTRTMRLTAPKALHQVATTRVFKSTKSSTPLQNGVPAIAFLSASPSPAGALRRRSSLPRDGMSRAPMPLPEPPSKHVDQIPPLPPRNSRTSSSMRKSPRPFSVFALDSWNDSLPTRPPPQPPAEDLTVPERPKSHSVSTCTDSKTAVEDDVWETLDKDCLDKLRAERSSQKKKGQPFPCENSTDLLSQKTATNSDLLDVLTPHPAISLDEIERSPSPVFEAFSFAASNVAPVLPDPAETFSPSNELAPLQNNVKSLEDQHEDIESVPDIPPRSNSIQSPSMENEDGSAHSRSEMAPADTDEYIGTAPVDTFSTCLSSEKTYENITLRVQESPKAPYTLEQDALQTAAQDDTEADSPRTTTASPTLDEQKDSSSSGRSTPSAETNIESESNVQIEPKVSRSSSRNSLKQKNGFHLSSYSVASDDSSRSVQHVSFTCNYLPSPTDWTPPTDLSVMTVDEVANSLRYIGMNEDTVEWFRAEKVDGQLLCLVEDDAINEHFHLSPFQRRKLAMFLKGWRPKLP